MQNKNGSNLLYPCSYSYLGVSLLECLLALTLGSFLLCALLTSYLSLKVTWQLQQALVDIQENGRFASYYLAQKIRSAGENSCQPEVQSQTFVRGYSAAQMQQLLPGRLMPGTDVLSLYECIPRDQTTQYLQIFYFIADTSRKDKAGNSIYSLYEKRGDSPSQELVENTNDMQIKYGLKQVNKIGLNYQTSDHINNWNDVRSVLIYLKLNSSWPIFHSSDLTDGRLYKPWEVYAAIRKIFTS